MGISLDPELSYIIGLWRKNKTKEGIGVKGEDVGEVFSKAVIDKGITTSDKLLTEDNKFYFYHSSYKKFFEKMEEDQLHRFKYMNEYAANYLAGLFDGAGEVSDKGVVSLRDMSKKDEVMLLRLGFQTKREDSKLIIERPKVFLSFIKDYVRLKQDHEVFDYVE